MDKVEKIKNTIKDLEHIETTLLSEDDIKTVKIAILLLSDYAKWYDYRTPQRELYELIEKR